MDTSIRRRGRIKRVWFGCLALQSRYADFSKVPITGNAKVLAYLHEKQAESAWKCLEQALPVRLEWRNHADWSA